MVWRPLTAAQLEGSFKVGVPEGVAPLQVMITVPKKKRRHAVDRVLMRRRIREGWRLQRRALRAAVEAHPELRTLSVGLIYVADENIESARVHARIGKLIAKLIQQISSHE